MSVYTPDDWKILKIIPVDTNFPTYYRILCSWAGSYLYGSSWKLSSGIETFKEDGDWYFSDQSSGSIYKLHKSAERISGIMAGIYTTLLESSQEHVNLETVDLNDFLKEFK